MKMDIGMMGLGKLGANMTTCLLGKGHRVVAFHVKEEAVRAAEMNRRLVRESHHQRLIGAWEEEQRQLEAQSRCV